MVMEYKKVGIPLGKKYKEGRASTQKVLFL